MFINRYHFKYFLLFGILIFSQPSQAKTDCNALNDKLKPQIISYYPRVFFQVQGNKGLRVYFHTAPSKKCKQHNIFIIPEDSVIAYKDIQYNNETWVNVMYIGKHNEVQGWIKKKYLKETGHIYNP